MLDLSSVTLIAVNTVCHELTDMAVADCIKHANFGDVILFSDIEHKYDTILIDKFENLSQAGKFTTHVIPTYIKTSHALFIHWDSWIIDPEMWKSHWLEYDYIGAPWWYTDGYNVGNSGFNLRSKRLLDFLAANHTEFPMMMPEDHGLCRTYRPALEKQGFRWANVQDAFDFSFERSRNSIESRHFGFHGMFNWPFVLPPKGMADRMAIARTDPYVQGSGMITELDRLCNVNWIKA